MNNKTTFRANTYFGIHIYWQVTKYVTSVKGVCLWLCVLPLLKQRWLAGIFC